VTLDLVGPGERSIGVIHHKDQEEPPGRRIELAEDDELRRAHREGETG
jgi:hypothetical protein